jgi:2-methylcitrate dehydratase PrpD
MTTAPSVLGDDLARLAGHAAALRRSDLPELVHTRASIAVFDFAITALEGMRAETARAALHAMGEVDGGGGACHVAGSAHGWPPRAAAFANGTAAFAQNFGDTSFHTILHGTPSVVPAALAAAEWLGGTGADFLAAVVAGYDTAERFGRVLNGGVAELGHYRRGFHTTGTCGALGATAAAARAGNADERTVLSALCVAATYASGLRGARAAEANAIPLWTHGGHAAANGILALGLVRAGMTADPGAVVGPFGFFSALAGPALNPDALAEGLGQRFSILDYGVKLYPVGHLLIPTIEAMLEVRARTSWRHADRIHLAVPSEHLRIGNLVPDPRSFSVAQSSFPFIAALALVEGDVTAAGIMARMADDEVVRLARTVDVAPDEELTRLAEEEQLWAARSEVALDGHVETAAAGPSHGSRERPATWEDLRAKASRMEGADAAVARRIEAAVRGLATAPDVAELAAALSAP